MEAKLALSFALAALILAAGGFLAVFNRLGDLEAEKPARLAARSTEVAPPGDAKAGPNPLRSQDPLVKLDWIIQKLEEIDGNEYDYYSDTSQDLFGLKREVRQLKSTLKQVVQGLGRGPGAPLDIGWGLAPKEQAPDAATLDAYREAAAEYGIQVEEGRVTARGFLNFSPDARMPIEFFITRFPESSHETLVHLIGNKKLEDMDENPYLALKGLSTALYKALVAAGFREGQPTHPDPGSDPRDDPTWVLASGDTVYLAVRYEHGGQTHVARATDWVVDPVAGAVLPPDSLKFTGGARGEDPDTGEPVLAAEAMGVLVSVWPTSAALVEVALNSARRNDYTYNFARIPKGEGEGPLYLDLVFSRTPVAPEGDGAKPLERPPTGDTGSEYPRGDDEEEDGPR